MKYIKELVEIRGEGEFCVLFSHPEEEITQIDLCNSIGSTIESKQVGLEVTVFAMSKTHIVVCS